MTPKRNRRVRAALLATTLVASAVLTACGGGEQVKRFVPSRVLAFGDETSVIDDSGSTGNGRKYSVNALASDGVTIDCRANPIWIQDVALAFGLVFPQCNTGSSVVANPVSRIYATAGAKVADVTAQIDQHVAAGGFVDTDLVLMLAGANDLLALYAQYPGVDEATLLAQAEAAGTALALQVNRIAEAGGKVVIATTPDLGLTPFGLAEEAASPGRSGVLTRLSARFNAKLRVTVLNDGRRIGLVFADEALQTAYKFAAQTGFTNVLAPVCDPAKAPTLPQCTTATLVTSGSAVTWLWADATHLSPGGQALLGQIALSRAVNNPF